MKVLNKEIFFNIGTFQIFLISIFPASIIIGPLIAEIIINLINIIFVYQIIRKKNFKIFKNKIFFILNLFLCLYKSYNSNIFRKQ
jgi:hypothetical protein